MRAVVTVVLGAIGSGLLAIALIAGAVQLGVGLQPGPHEQFEFAAVTVAETMVAVGTAVVLAIVLAFGGRLIAIRRTAVTLAVLLVVAFAAPEIFGLVTSTSAYVSVNASLTQDVPVLATVAVPGLLTIFIQCGIVTRYVVKRSARGDA